MKVLRSSSFSLTVQPSFFVLPCTELFAIFQGTWLKEVLVLMAVLLFLFIVHELGHVFVARLLRCSCDTVIGIGGGKTAVHGRPLKWWHRIAILSGGIISTYLCVFGSHLWIFATQGEYTHMYGCAFLLYILSAAWFWFNVLPLYPFDGGEIALEIGGALLGRIGHKVVALLSICLSVLLVLFLLFKGTSIGVILALYCLVKSFELFRYPALFQHSGLSHDEVYVREIEQLWLAGKQETAILEMQRLAHESKEKKSRQQAIELCSEYLLSSDRPREAYELLIHAKGPLAQLALDHLQLAAYRTSHWREGLDAGRQAFRICPTVHGATMCALLAARLELADEAIAWIRAAKRLGLQNLEEVLVAQDFDSIRSNVEFQKLLSYVV